MGKSKSANTITPAIATAAAKTKKEKSSGGAPLGDAVKPSSDNESSPLQPSSSWSKRALIARNINTGVYDVDSPNQSVFPAAAEEDELNTVSSAPRTKVTQQQQSKKESSSLSSRVGAKQQRTTTSTLSSSSLLLWSAIFVVIVAIVFSGNEDLTFTSKVGRAVTTTTTTTSKLSSTTSTSSSSSNTAATTTTSSSTQSTTTTTTTTTAPPPPPPAWQNLTCGSNTQVGGYFSFNSPNVSSELVVGTKANVSWAYQLKVDLTHISYIQIHYLLASQTVRDISNTNLVANLTNISSHANWTLWTVPQLQDGSYVMRISANGIDPGVAVAQGATTPPCFPLGVPAPGLSGQFNILNQAQNTNTYPDKYGPWSNGGLRGGGRGVMLVVSLLTLAALLL